MTRPSRARPLRRRRPLVLAVFSLVTTLAACGEPQARFTEAQVLGGQEVSAEVLNQGARVYALFCVSCHAGDGSGRGNAARSFDKPPRDFREGQFEYVSGPPGSLPTDEDLATTIREGRPGTGMPAWNGLSVEDQHAVIQYLKTFSPRWSTPVPPTETRSEP